ncbi:MFS transporter [Ralstonia insidiosa]|uniref:MFS transporter n=3 Tax=Pseudomonadota TaxID=1224 RepID=UPI0006649C40|nr:MFS transporter [Ralstonia insidiosa]KMW44245.1 MFS transporter [Ralstonia sp. MD27]MCK8647812.1 MFS transporter [Ralstonia insidiosa]MDE4926882.1 MFS transporter [Ralstonia insidiosa]UNK02523.1 MFS transporter [Ralstonia insidiosa]
MNTTTHQHPQHARRWLVLAAVCMAGLILPLSFTGAAVATPAIGRTLGGSATALNWVVNGFMLAFGSCLMVAGAMADAFGRKRIFASGIALFVLASIGVAVAPGVTAIGWLRGLQGVAAAMSMAGGSAALAQEFDGHARIRAFSLLGTTFGVGLAFGPLIAGALIQAAGWRAIFALCAVVGTLAFVFGVPRMRETRDPDARGVDWAGAASFTATLVLLTWALMEAPERGWADGAVLMLFAAAVIGLVAFIVIEQRVSRPMLDLSLFRFRRFVGVQFLPIATACYVVMLVVLPARLIGIEGQSETQAGITMIALSLPLLMVPLLAVQLAHRWSAATLTCAGLLVAAVGFWWLGDVAPGAAATAWIAPMLLTGFGTGFAWGLMDGLSVSVVPKERAGMATGIFSTTRVAGEAIALAVVGAALTALIVAQTGTSGTVSAAAWMEAAHRTAMGNVSAALTLLPAGSGPMLTAAYGVAFAQLAHALAVVSVVSAAVVWGLLGRSRAALSVATESV